MSKKKFVKLIVLIFIVFLSNVAVFKYCDLESKNITLSYEVISDKQDSYQLFYGNDSSWKEEQSQKIDYTDINNKEKLEFTIPKSTKELRFDFGEQPGKTNISDVKLSYFGKEINLDLNQLLDKSNQNQIGETKQEEGAIDLLTTGTDPHITYKVDIRVEQSLFEYENIINYVLKSIICILIDILILIVLRKSKGVLVLIQEIKNNRTLIWGLAKK